MNKKDARHKEQMSRVWRVAIYNSVGPGWSDIIYRMLVDLTHMGWNGTLEQIKEKFGGLRVYIGYGSPQVFGRIEAAELESLRTCENCGEPGKLRK